MARKKAKAPSPVTGPMEAAVASAVMAHPKPTELAATAPEFAAWATEAQRVDMSAQQAGQKLEARRVELEREVERSRRNARVFTPSGRLRPARYRHGSEFCPRCSRHKDFGKECPQCGHVEWTR